ncbi:hypothetical protein CEQ21_09675 [Niallia circulans]|uniref:Uncharacterized protein n=1 Tax=Niallia circulans TaxID=1397 RepID=A0A553SFW6_NIACI|nr:hypothetical protein CEQ21_09675 [Niallia circulans]
MKRTNFNSKFNLVTSFIFHFSNIDVILLFVFRKVIFCFVPASQYKESAFMQIVQNKLLFFMQTADVKTLSIMLHYIYQIAGGMERWQN